MTTEGEFKVSERNKKLVRDFFETVINKRKPADISKFVASDGTCGGRALEQMVSNPDPTRILALGTDRLVPPATRRRGGAAEKPDLAAFRDFTEHVLKAFPDMKVKIESVIAEGDQVVVRWTSTGTHKGEFLGTPPTGRAVPMTNVDIFTIENGKIAGVQSHPDGAAVLQAMGHLPETPLAAALGFGGGQ